MRFKDQAVWVRVDEGGRPVLDSDGRAEMKYREADERTYRPAGGNLVPLSASEAARLPAETAPRKPTAARRPAGAAPLANPAEAIHVWTDGACTGNPGPMGIGMVVIGPGVRREAGEYLGVGTNNIAEVTAIEHGLAIVASLLPALDPSIRVYSDSAYAIGLLSEGWKAQANEELVARLRACVATVPQLGFVKVAGHAGVVDNERCDELARQAIQKRGTV
jgi:ribonuclease HI